MTNLIVFNNSEKLYFKTLGIEVIILFGSQAVGAAGPVSDYDIGVLINHIRISTEKQKNKIYDTLYDLLSAKIKKLVNIDIVFLRDMPMELQSHAAKYGVVLFEDNDSAFANFREEVMNKYADFAPLRRVFHKAILERIPL